jgi:lysyl-tRNA synthetase class 1
MSGDWVTKLCDRIEHQIRRTRGEGTRIVCSSGISPSGPIHLGNLREIITVHFVTEELKARGWQAEHLHIWDDYDRLRKIPAGIDPSFAEHIGQPLSDIPDPLGEYPSYADRYMNQFIEGLETMQVRPQHVRQSLAYRAGNYTEKIKEAMRKRGEIFDILAEYQTAIQETAEERAARREAYYPFRVYCEVCHYDNTQITHYDTDSATISYTCQNGHSGHYSLNEKVEGKLVWKVDWPMRWSALGVDFEPAGADHATPGSSFTVGLQIVKEIFHSPQPQYASYAFVGMEGRTKISSSIGTNATLNTGLQIFEPALLRWLYVRRANTQGFNIDFGQGLLRLYDEWDSLERQMKQGKANEQNLLAYERSTRTSHGEVAHTPQPAPPFSLLASVLDITQGNIEQVTRIVSMSLKEPREDLDPRQMEPRLTCARNWVNNFLPDDERTHIRSSFDAEGYAQLSDDQQQELQMLIDSLDTHWSLDGLTELMYNIPKLVRGLPLDTKPNDELKQAQRAFFVAIYTLICGADTGPRIPTLLLSLGKERVKSLLSPEGQLL